MDAGSARPTGRGVRGAAWALAAAVLWPGAAGAERVALVIGNGAYEHVQRLPNPGNDATDVGAAFEGMGYAVTRLDDAGFDALRRGLLDFTRAASASEVAVVFYAGHGIEVDGRNFLVPVDARLQSDRDVEYEAVPLSLVTRAVGGARRLGLVVLDACRDNPFVVKLADAGATRSIGRGLARVAPSGGTLVAYAAEDGKTAADGDGRNSPYTGALLRYLEEPGLEVGRLFRKVRAEVERTTGGAQTPIEYGKLPDADIYLASAALPKDTGATAGGTPDKTPPPAGDAAKAAYKEAKEVGNVAAMLAVVKRFPGTFEADLAQAWIDKHEQEPLVVAGGDDADEAPPVVTPPPPSPEAVEQGLKLSDEARRLVQMGLAAAGHDPGLADGVFGGRTRKALRAWQESKELEGTGYLTREQSEGLAGLGREEAQRLRAEAEERRRAEAEARRKRARKPGDTFRDCPGCPEMVVVPGGTTGRPFAVGIYEVTRGEYGRFVSESGRSTGSTCWIWNGWAAWGGAMKEHSGRNWKSPGYGQTDAHPVVCVNWNDAQAYVRWLSGKTDHEYRLLSESEWEYVARAGTATEYWWGNDIGRNRANCDSCGDSYDYTALVGSFSANPFGLHDVHGNVSEWVEDCNEGNCGRRVVRGGSWVGIPRYLRSAFRVGISSGLRLSDLGFRVARTLTP